MLAVDDPGLSLAHKPPHPNKSPCREQEGQPRDAVSAKPHVFEVCEEAGVPTCTQTYRRAGTEAATLEERGRRATH